MDLAAHDDFSAFGLTERENFSIFVQYPDIEFDPELTKMHQHDHKHFSSPASNAIENEEGDSSHASSSTAHTTPSKHPMFAALPHELDEYTVYKTLLNRGNLPAFTKDYLTNIGEQIVQIGGLVQLQEFSSTHHALILQLTSHVSTQIYASFKSITTQLSAVSSLLSLTAFSLRPTDLTLWSTYLQRVRLITKSLSLPTFTEHRLLHSLLALFNAFVYHPLLHLTSTTAARLPFPSAISDAIHNVYDLLCALISTYWTWISSLEHLKQTTLVPLVRRIQESNFVKREIEQTESILASAREALRSGMIAVPTEYSNDQIAGVVKMNAGRNKSGAGGIVMNGTSTERGKERVKRRWKRQMTV